MTLYKVSFSSDTLEGLQTLTGLSSAKGGTESNNDNLGVSAPPEDSSQQSPEELNSNKNMDDALSHPPLPGDPNLDVGNLDQIQEFAPPSPDMIVGSSGDMFSSSAEVAPPPMLDLVDTASDESSTGMDYAIASPPEPDQIETDEVNHALNPERLNPPQEPKKRQTKRTKK